MDTFTKMFKNAAEVLKLYKAAGSYIGITCADDCYTFTDGETFYATAPVQYNPEGPTAGFQKTYAIQKQAFLDIAKLIKNGDSLEITEADHNSIKFTIAKKNGGTMAQTIKSDTHDLERYNWGFPKNVGKENRIDFLNKENIRYHLACAHDLLENFNRTFRAFEANLHLYPTANKGEVLMQILNGNYVIEKLIDHCREMPDLLEVGLHVEKQHLPAIIKLCDVTNPTSHLQFSWYRLQLEEDGYRSKHQGDLLEVMGWWNDGKTDVHQMICLRVKCESDDTIKIPSIEQLESDRIVSGHLFTKTQAIDEQLKNNGFLKNPKKFDVVVKDKEWEFIDCAGGMTSLCHNDFALTTERPVRFDANDFTKIMALHTGDDVHIDFYVRAEDGKFCMAKMLGGYLTAWWACKENFTDD